MKDFIEIIERINQLPLFLAKKVISSAKVISSTKSFKKKPVQKPEYKLEEIEMIIKKSDSSSASNEFIKDFDVNKKHEVFIKHASETPAIERKREFPPMAMNRYTKETLKQSIVISIPHVVDRLDLEFVAFSRLDHQPIYRYIGNDFANFDLPYTEMISEEILPPPPLHVKPRSYRG